jgi:hypothetical protein
LSVGKELGDNNQQSTCRYSASALLIYTCLIIVL